MSPMDAALHARIARIDALRSRFGLAAVLCALGAVGLAALGHAAASPGRLVAFGLLAVGTALVVARLRLAWTRVALARAVARAADDTLSSPSN